MNDLDKLIQEKIKTEYDNIAPDKDSLVRIEQGVKASAETKKVSNPWAKYYRVAAVIIIAILVAVNGNSIKAFVMNVYEKYLSSLANDYKEETSEWAKELDLTVEIEDALINVDQYVVTNRGVDFKITQAKEGSIDMVGCELYLEARDCMVQETFVKSDGCYIASNIFEDGSWNGTDKEVRGTLELMYMDENSELKSVLKEVTLDVSDVYQCREITNKNSEILVDKEYTITSITLNTWYMKITYAPKEKWDGKSLLNIEQAGKPVLFLGGSGDDEEVMAIYQLPGNMEEPLNISLANIVFDKDGSVDIVGETHELKLADYLKEDK